MRSNHSNRKRHITIIAKISNTLYDIRSTSSTFLRM